VRSVSGKRILVVGATSGLGRAIGMRLAADGARVALAGRRKDRLDAAVAEAGPGVLGIVADVREPASCEDAVAAAADTFGGLDGLVYCPGIGHLARLSGATPAQWLETIETNVLGAAYVTQAALPHLTRARGVAVYLSSITASVTRPWPGLGMYTVSKAALDKLVEAFRVEHPEVGFTRVVVGPASGEEPNLTEFAVAWDADLAGELMPVWVQRGYMDGSVIEPADFTDQIVAILASPATFETVVIQPRPAS
jgi:NAD(P)-dependent dehydrogenase (short-subunit alcohol dehydrogenase family)